MGLEILKRKKKKQRMDAMLEKESKVEVDHTITYISKPLAKKQKEFRF